MVMDDIKNRFVGKWKLHRSENFEDFLGECGVNFFVRKMAGMASPVSEISVKEGDKVHISMVTSFMTQEDCFSLGEEFEKDMRGNKMVGKPSFVDGKIIIQYTPKDPSIKPQKVTRETMEIGDVVCLNVVFRKMAGAAKPVIEIKIENDSVNIVSKVSFFNQVISFKLDEPYQQNYEGLEMNCMSKWENGKIITEANPVAEGKGKAQKFVREVSNDELIQTMYVGDIKCVRVFKRTSD
ncbi:sodium/calcium exchanger regulatory protein 1-like [Crassostrea virginica]